MVTLYSVPVQCNRWTVLTPFQGHPLCQSETERRLGISFWGLGIVLVLVSLKSGSVCVGPSFVSPMIHEDPSWSLTLWFSRAASAYHCVVKIACMILTFPQHEKCCAQTPVTYHTVRATLTLHQALLFTVFSVPSLLSKSTES